MCYSIYLIHYEVISAAGRFTKTFGARLPNPVYLIVQFVLVGGAIVLICGIYFVVTGKAVHAARLAAAAVEIHQVYWPRITTDFHGSNRDRFFG